MAITGYNFEEYTGSTRLAMCRQYLSGLRAIISTPDGSADGKSLSHATLAAMIRDTEARLTFLENTTRAYGGITLPKF